MFENEIYRWIRDRKCLEPKETVASEFEPRHDNGVIFV